MLAVWKLFHPDRKSTHTPMQQMTIYVALNCWTRRRLNYFQGLLVQLAAASWYKAGSLLCRQSAPCLSMRLSRAFKTLLDKLPDHDNALPDAGKHVFRTNRTYWIRLAQICHKDCPVLTRNFLTLYFVLLSGKGKHSMTNTTNVRSSWAKAKGSRRSSFW